ncbi:MAG: ParM/StbA family protein [Bacteroidota bacterium]
MKKKSYSFPSMFEATNEELNFVSKDLINGIQLYDEDQAYILGNLAVSEGLSPNKAINSSPDELDYSLFLKAGILLACQSNNRPLTITTGLPFSTYNIYKKMAEELILDIKSVDYNKGTYSNKGKTNLKTQIQKVEILPEMVGNIIGLRVGEENAEGSFFVVSLGYGTCEVVLSTDSGIVHRTAASITGMQYAVDMFMRALSNKYYLGFKTEKQLDMVFRNDYIILNRKKVDIVDLRKRVLERYYEHVISPVLKRSFTDADFEKADRIYLTGGGALYPELIDAFNKEFSEIATVEVVKNPLTLTSEGYSLNSIMLTGGDKSTAIGLDVGNANTVLTQYESDKSDKKESFKPVFT